MPRRDRLSYIYYIVWGEAITFENLALSEKYSTHSPILDVCCEKHQYFIVKTVILKCIVPKKCRTIVLVSFV